MTNKVKLRGLKLFCGKIPVVSEADDARKGVEEQFRFKDEKFTLCATAFLAGQQFHKYNEVK